MRTVGTVDGVWVRSAVIGVVCSWPTVREARNRKWGVSRQQGTKQREGGLWVWGHFGFGFVLFDLNFLSSFPIFCKL